MKKTKKFKNDIDEAIHKYTAKQWGEHTYHSGWKAAYEEGKKSRKSFKPYETLWKAVYEEVRENMYGPYDDEMKHPKMTAEEAVEKVRRSRYYVSEADFYRNSVKKELIDLGYNRNLKELLNYNTEHKAGTFVTLNNIQYLGNVEFDGKIYKSYSFISNGKLLYYYSSRSPKDELYLKDLMITEEPLQ